MPQGTNLYGNQIKTKIMVKKKREITEGKKYISNSNNVYAEMVCIEKGNVE